LWIMLISIAALVCGAPASLSGSFARTPALSGRCWHGCWGHGLCDPATGNCTCDPGYSGTTCIDGRCPNNCSTHGRCVLPTVPLSAVTASTSLIATVPTVDDLRLATLPSAGGCECEGRWTGIDCSLLRCVDDCAGHGTCLNGTCACDRGYFGSSCSRSLCKPECINGGACIGGSICRCPSGFHGARCEVAYQVEEGTSVPNTLTVEAAVREDGSLPCAGGGICSSNGQCIQGKCICNLGWAGVGCGEKACELVPCAIGHGRCVRGRCHCRPPWQPPFCQLGRCPKDCSGAGHGYCNTTSANCVCQPGWAGPDCATSWCPSSCNSRGRCSADGKCKCNPPYGGLACEWVSLQESNEVIASETWQLPPPPSVVPSPSSRTPSPSSLLSQLPPSPALPLLLPSLPPLSVPLFSSPPYPLSLSPSVPPVLPMQPPESVLAQPSQVANKARYSSDPVHCPLGCGHGICRRRVCYCLAGWTGVACQMPLSAASLLLPDEPVDD